MGQIGVFISYAHEDVGIARTLKESLESDGFEVWIDEGAMRAGDSLFQTIATAIHDMEFVVALISAASVDSNWCQREISLAMTSGLNREGVKLLPVRVGDVAIPVTLEDTFCLPLELNSSGGALERLASDIRSHHAGRIAAGEKGEPLPTTGYRAPPAQTAESQPLQPDIPPVLKPIRIVGVVKEGVGTPRNDETAGSALYRVPLRLSTTPTAEWGQIFVEVWNHPPRFSTMHRPGIASVAGDTIVLDGTSLPELEKYHASTLKLCVERTNEHVAERYEKRYREARRKAEAEEAHKREVDEIADRIKFD